MPTIADKRRAFRKLHETGCFVIPNPWDIGSARYLQLLGFKALATTSAGFAFSRALPDGYVPRDMVLAHIREIVEATELPVNADFEAGYADQPGGGSLRMYGCAPRPAWQDFQLRMRLASASSRFTTSTPPLRACAQRAPRSTKPAAM